MLRFSILTFLICCLALVEEFSAQDQADSSPPYAKAAKLRLFFDDGFTTKSSANYKEKGEVDWRDGLLELGPNASVTRKVDGFWWAESTLKPLIKNDKDSTLESRYELRGVPDCYVAIGNKEKRGFVRIGVVGASEATGSVQFDEAIGDSSVFKVVYRIGEWSIYRDNKMVLTETINPAAAPLLNFSLHNTGPGLFQVNRLTMSSSPVVLFSPKDIVQATKASRLKRDANLMFRKGDFDSAISTQLEAISLYESVYGIFHPDVSLNLGDLAFYYSWRGEGQKAKETISKAIKLKEQVYGPTHFVMFRSLNNLANLLLRETDFRGARTNFLKAKTIAERAKRTDSPYFGDTLQGLADCEAAMGEFDKAKGLYEQALKVFRDCSSTVGVASCLNASAQFYASLGDYDLALAQIKESLRLTPKSAPPYMGTSVNYATIAMQVGDYREAEKYYLEAAKACKSKFGEEFHGYATIMHNLGLVKNSQHKFAEAEPYLAKAVSIRKKNFGENNLRYSNSIEALANNYASLGQVEKSRPLLQQVLAIQENKLGKNHLQLTQILTNIGTNFLQQGDFASARKYLNRARLLLEKHPDKKRHAYAVVLNNLASLHRSEGNTDMAMELMKKSMEINRSVFGENHAELIEEWHNLGGVYWAKGELGNAIAAFDKSLEIAKNINRKHHPQTANTHEVLGMIYLIQQNDAKARQSYAKSMEIMGRYVNELSIALSEQNQIRMTREIRASLDGYLSTKDRGPESNREILQFIFQWQGNSLARQRRYRAQPNGVKARILTDLRRTASQLMHAFQNPPNLATTKSSDVAQKRAKIQLAAWEKRIQTLEATKEDLEKQLARENGVEQIQSQIKLDDILDSIPKNAALVTYIEYRHSEFNPDEKDDLKVHFKTENNLVAFVATADRSIKRIDLGPAATINDAISDWRTKLGSGKSGREMGKKLRRLVWDPIADQIGSCKSVLITPDGQLGTISFASLPNIDDGTYLAESHRFSIVPAARFLKPKTKEDVNQSEKNMLLIGGVDYDKSTTSSRKFGPNEISFETATRSGNASNILRKLKFDSAIREATKAEVQGIQKIFTEQLGVEKSNVKLFTGSTATEGRFRDNAPEARYVHIATHGYFSDAEFKSLEGPSVENSETVLALIGNDRNRANLQKRVSPGLLSGLALAGANGDLVSLESQDAGQTFKKEPLDDGVLTAEEIAFSSLNGIELVVLSACETGLGKATSGEGILGLQRAFQVAGAKSVIASLWKVDDRATKLLMTRFYTNLLGKKMSQNDALREAQLWLLYNPRMAVTGDLSNEVWTGGQPPAPSLPRTPPRFWAAWVISGCDN